MIQVQVIGADAMAARITDIANPARRKRMLAIAGQAIRNRHVRLMTDGLDPNGVPLPPVQRWTRWVSGYNEKSKVLHRTGTLRRQLGVLMTTADMVKVGFTGGGAKVAQAMTYGLPGKIKVASKIMQRAASLKRGRRFNRSKKPGSVGLSRSGSLYVRLKSNSGRWFTKKITDGHISVKPKARRFFYIGRGDISDINRAVNVYYAKLTAQRR